MAHKYPPRRCNTFGGAPIVDVDDFNESLFAAGAEAGLLDETNFGGVDAFGSTDADRTTHMERDVGFASSRVTDPALGPQLDERDGWTTLVYKVVSCGDATLRISGRYSVDALIATGTLHQADIRINGQRVYDHMTDQLSANTSPNQNVFALVDVPAGTHRVELVATYYAPLSGAAVAADRKTLSVLVMEK